MAREDDERRVDELLAAVGRQHDDARIAASAAARSRRRWLRQQAAESSTMAGVLVTLAEHDGIVTLRCGPWTHRGRLRTVTEALVIVERSDGVALVPTQAIAAVEAPVTVADDRTPGPGPDLPAVLAALVPERPRVRLLLGDGTSVAGTLEGVGKDVATVRLASSAVSVRLSLLAGCILAEPSTDLRSGRAQGADSGPDRASLDDLGSG